jgi:hypothetical protein
MIMITITASNMDFKEKEQKKGTGLNWLRMGPTDGIL